MFTEDFQAIYESIWYNYFETHERTEDLDELMEEIYNLALAYKGEI